MFINGLLHRIAGWFIKHEVCKDLRLFRTRVWPVRHLRYIWVHDGNVLSFLKVFSMHQSCNVPGIEQRNVLKPSLITGTSRQSEDRSPMKSVSLHSIQRLFDSPSPFLHMLLLRGYFCIQSCTKHLIVPSNCLFFRAGSCCSCLYTTSSGSCKEGHRL